MSAPGAQASEGAVANPFAYPKGDCHPGHHEFRGMTLRDWFAGQALAGMGTWMPALSSASLVTPSSLQDRAEWAYKQADAMLRARLPAAAVAAVEAAPHRTDMEE